MTENIFESIGTFITETREMSRAENAARKGLKLVRKLEIKYPTVIYNDPRIIDPEYLVDVFKIDYYDDDRDPFKGYRQTGSPPAKFIPANLPTLNKPDLDKWHIAVVQRLMQEMGAVPDGSFPPWGTPHTITNLGELLKGPSPHTSHLQIPIGTTPKELAFDLRDGIMQIEVKHKVNLVKYLRRGNLPEVGQLSEKARDLIKYRAIPLTLVIEPYRDPSKKIMGKWTAYMGDELKLYPPEVIDRPSNPTVGIKFKFDKSLRDKHSMARWERSVFETIMAELPHVISNGVKDMPTTHLLSSNP